MTQTTVATTVLAAGFLLAHVTPPPAHAMPAGADVKSVVGAPSPNSPVRLIGGGGGGSGGGGGGSGK